MQPLDPALVDWAIKDHVNLAEADSPTQPGVLLYAEEVDKLQAAAAALLQRANDLLTRLDQVSTAAGIIAEPAGKGTLYVHDGAVPVKVPGGSAAQVLAGDPLGPSGARWLEGLLPTWTSAGSGLEYLHYPLAGVVWLRGSITMVASGGFLVSTAVLPAEVRPSDPTAIQGSPYREVMTTGRIRVPTAEDGQVLRVSGSYAK